MIIHEMQDVIDEIELAYSGPETPPAKGEVALSRSSVEQLDVERLTERLAGKPWDLITLKDLSGLSMSMHLLTCKALSYYIPAYLLLGITYWNSGGSGLIAGLEAVLGRGDNAEPIEKDNEIYCFFYELPSRRRRALAAFFERLLAYYEKTYFVEDWQRDSVPSFRFCENILFRIYNIKPTG